MNRIITDILIFKAKTCVNAELHEIDVKKSEVLLFPGKIEIFSLEFAIFFKLGQFQN